jgi:hypothetical protein
MDTRRVALGLVAVGVLLGGARFLRQPDVAGTEYRAIAQKQSAASDLPPCTPAASAFYTERGTTLAKVASQPPTSSCVSGTPSCSWVL